MSIRVTDGMKVEEHLGKTSDLYIDTSINLICTLSSLSVFFFCQTQKFLCALSISVESPTHTTDISYTKHISHFNTSDSGDPEYSVLNLISAKPARNSSDVLTDA